MKKHQIILIFVLLIGLFFRSYQTTERFAFAHDGDLYSWIVKDIVVNGHFRLIGQLTSAEGIFVGPFFYYLLIPFFLIFKMDPVGIPILGVSIGLLTIISYYFVLSKLFNRTVGLIAAFLHAVLFAAVDFDRWIVPTVTTKLWAIWYLYTLLTISRGNFGTLSILGILVGLIWHVHIALLPTLLAIPAAILISRKIPSIKQVFLFLLTFITTSLPFIIFELRHNFLQILSIIPNFTTSQKGDVGFPKLIAVLEMIAKNTNYLFFAPHSLPLNFKMLFLLIILLTSFLLLKRRILKSSDIIPISTWLMGVVLFFTFSPTLISEYYFANLEIIFITIVSLFFTFMMSSSKFGFCLVLYLLGIILIKYTFFFVELKPYKVGYTYRKDVANYIAQDAKERKLPCVGITYITMLGENVGFRYFFYLNKLHLIHPSNAVPVYNIVLPYQYSLEVEKHFGEIGIISPTSIPSKEVMQKSCSGPNTNLTDPMFGYVD